MSLEDVLDLTPLQTRLLLMDDKRLEQRARVLAMSPEALAKARENAQRLGRMDLLEV